MTDVPAISVVIAARNEEALLGRCLRSLQAQTTTRTVELLVVDNDSTDQTAAIAAAAGARVVVCAELGAVHAKTAGVAAALAPLVAVIDADSQARPDWLERIATAFDARPELVGLTGPAHYVGAAWWVPVVMWCWFSTWKLVQLFTGRALYAVGTNVAFRRAAYERVGGFDTKVLVGGDEVGLFARLRRVGVTRYVNDLIVDTDARRTHSGLLHFLWRIFFLQYVLNYSVYWLTGHVLVKHYRPGSELGRKKLI